MPGPLARGLVISFSILVAAGIAIYENPQVRQWVDESRRKIAMTLHALGDEISTFSDEESEYRRSRQNNGWNTNPRASAFDRSMHEEESPEAQERRRRAREEIINRGRAMQDRRTGLRQRQGVVNVPISDTETPEETRADVSGSQLIDASDSIGPPPVPPKVEHDYIPPTPIKIEDSPPPVPPKIPLQSSAVPLALAIGMNAANPFSDEYMLEEPLSAISNNSFSFSQRSNNTSRGPAPAPLDIAAANSLVPEHEQPLATGLYPATASPQTTPTRAAYTPTSSEASSLPEYLLGESSIDHETDDEPQVVELPRENTGLSYPTIHEWAQEASQSASFYTGIGSEGSFPQSETVSWDGDALNASNEQPRGPRRPHSETETGMQTPTTSRSPTPLTSRTSSIVEVPMPNADDVISSMGTRTPEAWSEVGSQTSSEDFH